MSYNADPYTGAQYLFQGISNAGQSLGAGLNQGMKRGFEQNALKKLLEEYLRNLQPRGPSVPGGLGQYITPFQDRAPIAAPIMEYMDGGYTGPGAADEPAGVVHRNEYVVPSDQVDAAGGPTGIQSLLSSLARNPGAASTPGFNNILGLMEMGEKQKEEQKQLSTTGKAIKQILKANPDLAGQAGLMPEHIENLGSRDAVNLFKELTQAQALKANQARLQDYLREGEQDRALGTAINRYGAGPEALNNLNRSPLRDYAPGFAAPTTDQERRRFALQTPRLGGTGAVKLLQYLGAMKGADVNWDEVKPREGTTAGGMPFLFGKSGQFQLVPNPGAGVGPDGQVTAGQERALSDGTVQTWNGRGWVNSPRGQSDETKKKLGVEAMVEAEKALQELERQIRRHADRDALSKTDKSVTAPNPQDLKELNRRRDRLINLLESDGEPTKPTASTPPRAEDFQKGQRVKQNGVTYEFDGKEWKVAR
jgi:hypothetical protein